MGKAHGQSSRCEQLWDHAEAGSFLAIVPCRDDGDEMKVGFRLINSGLWGWIGRGDWEGGSEDFAVALCDHGGPLHAFVRRVQNDLGLSAIVAEGFKITLSLSISRDGETKAIFQQPFGVSARIEHTAADNLVLSFDVAEPPHPSRSEWLERLEAAYCEVRGYKSFTFKESHP